jgi:hypothetical protein
LRKEKREKCFRGGSWELVEGEEKKTRPPLSSSPSSSLRCLSRSLLSLAFSQNQKGINKVVRAFTNGREAIQKKQRGNDNGRERERVLKKKKNFSSSYQLIPHASSNAPVILASTQAALSG